METSNKTTSQDPRIDSPEIRVVYPSEPVKLAEKEAPVQTATATPQFDTVQPTTTTATTSATTTEQHVCQVSVVDSIKQHWLAFSMIGFCLFAFGYVIAKGK